MATRTNDLTEFAKPLADLLHKKVGSLKVVLSAGVIALSKLSAEEREQMIGEANGLNSDNLNQKDKEVEAEKKPVTLRQALHNMVERIKTEETIEGNVIKIEQSDEKTWEELRRIAEPESKPKRKKKGG